MKAVVCTRHGGLELLELQDLPSPEPGAGQVLIRVYAAGVNFPDTLIIKGTYQAKPDLPFTPGGEVAGIVLKVGVGVSHVKSGDRVLAAMIWGAFAEEALAEAWRVHPIPIEMDFPVAAGFTLTYGTSYHALKDRAALRKGETLLVLGASGGVGLAAIEIGKALGARVIAAASSEEKLELCTLYGADAAINYERGDLRSQIKKLTDGGGVNVVYDPVGGRYTDPALRSMAWRGRYLVVGFASGEIPNIALNLPLLKGCAVLGVYWGAFCRAEPENNALNMEELFALFRQGKLKPHLSEVFPMDQTTEALNCLTGRVVKGKVIIEMRV
ncbi:NADPH:quinone oxidoreductase family protein [Ferrovibrio sp.]|uniref:NADPH:quinone oxidoreductase family protein n=1 Tax=Ferrovibrio sp. TaxID=1917215 RepID=UPI003D115CE0